MSIALTNVYQLEWPESFLTPDILEKVRNHFGGSVPDAADEESVLPLVRGCVEVLVKTENIPLFQDYHLKDRDSRSFINRQIVRVDPPAFVVLRRRAQPDYFEVVVRRRVTFHPTEMKKVIKTVMVDGVEYQNSSMERVLGPLKETEEVFSVFAYPKTIRVFSAEKI